jgi:hypothetical protein
MGFGDGCMFYRLMRGLGLVAATGLTGCAGAPSRNILGSFFPSWMLCVLVGLVAAVLVSRGLALVGIDKVLPVPLLVYLALTVFFSFATWLLWLG